MTLHTAATTTTAAATCVFKYTYTYRAMMHGVKPDAMPCLLIACSVVRFPFIVLSLSPQNLKTVLLRAMTLFRERFKGRFGTGNYLFHT